MTRAKLDPAGPFGRQPLQPLQLIDRVTRTEDTVVLCHLGVPRIDPHDWSLSIDGLVRRPMRLTLGEVMTRPRVEMHIERPEAANSRHLRLQGKFELAQPALLAPLLPSQERLLAAPRRAAVE